MRFGGLLLSAVLAGGAFPVQALTLDEAIAAAMAHAPEVAAARAEADTADARLREAKAASIRRTSSVWAPPM